LELLERRVEPVARTGEKAPIRQVIVGRDLGTTAAASTDAVGARQIELPGTPENLA
jgi:hypothetical protein